jgi:hypothetical protein
MNKNQDGKLLANIVLAVVALALVVIGIHKAVAGGPPGYSGTTWADVDESYPQDEEQAQYGAASIRQTRRISKSMFLVEHSSNGIHRLPGLSITNGLLGNEAVDSRVLADGAVTSAKIANGLNYLHETSGFETLPSGLLIQWVSGTNLSDQSSQTVAFPRAFPNAVLTVQCSTVIEAGNGNDIWYQVTASTRSNAVVYRQSANGFATPAAPSLLAIGY